MILQSKVFLCLQSSFGTQNKKRDSNSSKTNSEQKISDVGVLPLTVIQRLQKKIEHQKICVLINNFSNVLLKLHV